MKKVIVVGAGILGATTAYYLAKSGADVTIVDRFDKGQATDAGAGIVCPWVSKRRNQQWYKLAKGGARLYKDLIEELAEDGEHDTGYARVGAVNLQSDETKLHDLKKHILKRRDDAPEIGEVTLMDTKETNNCFPLLADHFRAVHISGGARVDGRALRKSLLRAAKKHGLNVVNGSAELRYKSNKIIGVTVDGQALEADHVVAATGAWTKAFLQPLLEPQGVFFDVRPQRAQVIHLELPHLNGDEWPVVKPPYNQYMLAFKDRIIIGATQENKTGFDYRLTAGGVYEILHKAIETAPALADYGITETRIGFRPMTPESVPVLGHLPGFDGLVLANGLGASGLTMGPYVAKQLADMVLERELEIDLADYDVSKIIKKPKNKS